MKKQELKQSIGVNVFKDGSVATKKKEAYNSRVRP